MNRFLPILLLLATTAPSYAADDYERDIKNLTLGKSHEDIEASIQELKAAGNSAFPFLIHHFADRDLAEARYFQRDEVDRMADGSIRAHPPTIGEACFAIVQGEIEGNWPKAFRDYYILTPSNTEKWITAHRELTLPDLRRASLRESRSRAEKDLAKQPSDAFLKSTVAFLREELEKAVAR